MGDTLPIITREDSQREYSYEELFQGSVPCPSCKGSGRIPKEQEGQLIALIPVNDARLRPRRTTLWVLLAIFISLTVCSISVFFLIPRSVVLHSNESPIVPYASDINKTESYVKLSFITRVNITNLNYFPVSVVNASLSALNQLESRVVGHILNETSWSLAPRASNVVSLNGTIVFDEELMISYCEVVKVIFMQFQITVITRYLGRDEQTSLSANQRLFCRTTPTALVEDSVSAGNILPVGGIRR